MQFFFIHKTFISLVCVVVLLYLLLLQKSHNRDNLLTSPCHINHKIFTRCFEPFSDIHVHIRAYICFNLVPVKYLRLKLLTMNHVFIGKGKDWVLQKRRWSCNSRKIAFRFESINSCVSKTVRRKSLTAIKVSCNSRRTFVRKKSVTKLRKFLMQTITIRTNCMFAAFVSWIIQQW